MARYYHRKETSQDSTSKHYEAASLCSWIDSTIALYITMYVLEFSSAALWHSNSKATWLTDADTLVPRFDVLLPRKSSPKLWNIIIY